MRTNPNDTARRLFAFIDHCDVMFKENVDKIIEKLNQPASYGKSEVFFGEANQIWVEVNNYKIFLTKVVGITFQSNNVPSLKDKFFESEPRYGFLHPYEAKQKIHEYCVGNSKYIRQLYETLYRRTYEPVRTDKVIQEALIKLFSSGEEGPDNELVKRMFDSNYWGFLLQCNGWHSPSRLSMALSLAASQNNIQAVTNLLENGARSNEAVDCEGNTPLHSAMAHNNREMLEALLTHDDTIKPSQWNFKNMNALQLGYACRAIDAVDRLETYLKISSDPTQQALVEAEKALDRARKQKALEEKALHIAEERLRIEEEARAITDCKLKTLKAVNETTQKRMEAELELAQITVTLKREETQLAVEQAAAITTEKQSTTILELLELQAKTAAAEAETERLKTEIAYREAEAELQFVKERPLRQARAAKQKAQTVLINDLRVYKKKLADNIEEIFCFNKELKMKELHVVNAILDVLIFNESITSSLQALEKFNEILNSSETPSVDDANASFLALLDRIRLFLNTEIYVSGDVITTCYNATSSAMFRVPSSPSSSEPSLSSGEDRPLLVNPCDSWA